MGNNRKKRLLKRRVKYLRLAEEAEQRGELEKALRFYEKAKDIGNLLLDLE